MRNTQETGIYGYAAKQHDKMEGNADLINKQKAVSKEASQMHRAVAMGLNPESTIEEINAESLRLEDEMKKRERKYR